MKEVYDFLKECGTYYLATVEDNKAKVRPFGTIEMFEDKLYIQTGKSKDVFKQIQINPNIEICGFKNGKWLRISAKAIRDDRIEAKKHMLDNYPSLRNMYSETDNNTEVLYLEEVTATFCSFVDEPKVIKF